MYSGASLTTALGQLVSGGVGAGVGRCERMDYVHRLSARPSPHLPLDSPPSPRPSPQLCKLPPECHEGSCEYKLKLTPPQCVAPFPPYTHTQSSDYGSYALAPS